MKYDHTITTALSGESAQDHLDKMSARGWELVGSDRATRQYTWKKPQGDDISGLSIAAQIRALEDQIEAIKERIEALKASQPSEDTTKPKSKTKAEPKADKDEGES